MCPGKFDGTGNPAINYHPILGGGGRGEGEGLEIQVLLVASCYRNYMYDKLQSDWATWLVWSMHLPTVLSLFTYMNHTNSVCIITFAREAG